MTEQEYKRKRREFDRTGLCPGCGAKTQDCATLILPGEELRFVCAECAPPEMAGLIPTAIRLRGLR